MLKLRQACAVQKSPSHLENPEFWALHCWVSAVHPVLGASPAFLGMSAPCPDRHLCLLAPCPLPKGESVSLFYKLLVSPTTGHFNMLALLYLWHTSSLCLCCTETTEELFNKYQNKCYISAKTSVVFIFSYTCMPLQKFWYRSNKEQVLLSLA